MCVIPRTVIRAGCAVIVGSFVSSLVRPTRSLSQTDRLKSEYYLGEGPIWCGKGCTGQ